MVVFTDLNEEWLRAVRKDYSTIFMPLWTLKELQQGARLLSLAGSLNASDDALESPFNTFGGVARECFSSSEDFVEYAKSNLLDEIKRFTRLEDLQVLVKGYRRAVLSVIVLFTAARLMPKRRGWRRNSRLRLSWRELRSVWN